MKGVLQPDHIPQNKYALFVQGLPPIIFTAVSGLEEELDKVSLPDRTFASGGRTKEFEFTVKQPTHHTAERMAMEAWYEEGKDPVALTYKKPGTLVKQSLSGTNIVMYILQGLFVCKRNTNDLEMNNDGELDEIEWTIACDSVIAR